MTRVGILIGIASLFVGLFACLPLFEAARYVDKSFILREASALPSCAFDGNPDFYGLGIRVGICLQWITAYLANHFLREAIDSNLETNTIFLLALFIASAVTTSNNTVQTTELVVLLYLCFGFLFSILSIWGHRIGNSDHDGKKKIRFPLIGNFFRLTLATTVSAYGLWFWFTGRNVYQPRSSLYADFTFLFGKVDVTGAVHYFFELQSAIILAGYSLLFLREFLMITTLFCLVCGHAMIISALAVWFGSSRTLVVRERGRERLLKNKQSHSVSRDDEHREIVTLERMNLNAEVSFTNCFLGLVFLLKE